MQEALQAVLFTSASATPEAVIVRVVYPWVCRCRPLDWLWAPYARRCVLGWLWGLRSMPQGATMGQGEGPELIL